MSKEHKKNLIRRMEERASSPSGVYQQIMNTKGEVWSK